jgi:hypothetical protein
VSIFVIIIDVTLVIKIKFIVREREGCAAGEGEVCRQRYYHQCQLL